MMVDDDLRHRGLAESAAGIGLGVDHRDGGVGIGGDRFNRNQRDRNQVDHRPVFGSGNHAVDGENTGLPASARFDECLNTEHARQRVRVGVNVRNHHQKRNGDKAESNRSERVRRRRSGSESESVVSGIGRHRRRSPGAFRHA